MATASMASARTVSADLLPQRRALRVELDQDAVQRIPPDLEQAAVVVTPAVTETDFDWLV